MLATVQKTLDNILDSSMIHFQKQFHFMKAYLHLALLMLNVVKNFVVQISKECWNGKKESYRRIPHSNVKTRKMMNQFKNARKEWPKTTYQDIQQVKCALTEGPAIKWSSILKMNIPFIINHFVKLPLRKSHQLTFVQEL